LSVLWAIADIAVNVVNLPEIGITGDYHMLIIGPTGIAKREPVVAPESSMSCLPE
jgi:hypothetical protein